MESSVGSSGTNAALALLAFSPRGLGGMLWSWYQRVSLYGGPTIHGVCSDRSFVPAFTLLLLHLSSIAYYPCYPCTPISRLQKP